MRVRLFFCSFWVRTVLDGIGVNETKNQKQERDGCKKHTIYAKTDGKKWKKRTKIRFADNKQKKAFRIVEKKHMSSKREDRKVLRSIFVLL